MKKDILELNCFKKRFEQFPDLSTLFIGNLANTNIVFTGGRSCSNLQVKKRFLLVMCTQ